MFHLHQCFYHVVWRHSWVTLETPFFCLEFHFQIRFWDSERLWAVVQRSEVIRKNLTCIELHRNYRVFFLSDFIKFIWTLHVYVKKCAHSFMQRGQIAHTGRKLCLKMLSATGKKTDICAQKKHLPGYSCRIECHFPASSLTYVTGIQQHAFEMRNALVWSSLDAPECWSLFGRGTSGSLAMPDVLVK